MKERLGNRIVTTLVAEVSPENWEALQKAYRELGAESKTKPTESFLLQNKENPNLWRIVSVWENMDTIQKFRATGETPTGVLIFRAASAEPKLEVFEAKEEL